MSSTKKNPDGTDIESKTNHYGYKKNFRTALPQILAVSVKNLLLLGYGMTLGFPTILIPAVKNPKEGEVLKLENSEISWISSINLIVVPIGCALSGIVTTPLGRRRAMQVVNLPFVIAWLIFHFSVNTAHLYGALVLTGLAGGLLEAPVLTYVAEITQPHLRGALSATSSLCIIIGVFTQFLFGIFLYWRTVALVNITFAILAIVMLCFVPESPHWLVSRQRHEEAKKSLQWLRGWTNSAAVENELDDIKALYVNEKVDTREKMYESISNKAAVFLEKSFVIPFLLICYCFFVGHFSGMTTLQTYAVSIFQMLEAPIDKYYATLILGLLQMLGSAVCVTLVHYTGKRPLTIFSTAGTAVCCLLVATYDVYITQNGVNPVGAAATPTTLLNNNSTNTNFTMTDLVVTNSYSWIPTTLLMLLALISHTGIRLLPWILIGEVFSAKTRSAGAGLAGAMGYILGFLTNKMYINMVETISIYGTYGFYGIVCLSGSIVFFYILPETEGKKLNDIENHFAGIRRLTNDVYRSKNKSSKETSRMEVLKGADNPAFEADSSKL
ncbi:facilitated trehalose transporter Tret1-like [Hyposmocoma kahamanoa]|uniref:facilitated trehalose transporter Tret1-like n=1 Tax=Hyposmocoma kahamanoa TaxID=1477025 RepID=UPI000E6D69DD|nr:facilitated trehalose transporter Tret1-like [Hyposmocoma kahamanoa]XP_026332892.1 facilitated trehalose transporter Tret1-like [Hyposmocoma kahamanoa]